MHDVFNNDAYTCILFLALWWIVALFCTFIACAKCDGLGKIDVITKLVQIPAYVALLFLIFICLITIFTFFVSIILFVLMYTSILLSGVLGLFSIKENYSNGSLSSDKIIIYAVFQFIIITNVFTSIALYRHKNK